MYFGYACCKSHISRRGAGHAGALLGDTWYVAGGGNNAAGCADMLALDLGGLGAAPLAWAPVATAEPRSAIASESLSLLAAPAAGALVAFGGYNGRYHNTVQVFRPGAALELPQGTPSLYARC